MSGRIAVELTYNFDVVKSDMETVARRLARAIGAPGGCVGITVSSLTTSGHILWTVTIRGYHFDVVRSPGVTRVLVYPARNEAGLDVTDKVVELVVMHMARMFKTPASNIKTLGLEEVQCEKETGGPWPWWRTLWSWLVARGARRAC